METIKELLDSDIYLDIIKELGVDNFNQDVQSIEVEELKNRLRQRQFLLEGFNCKVLSEFAPPRFWYCRDKPYADKNTNSQTHTRAMTATGWILSSDKKRNSIFVFSTKSTL